MESCAAAVSWPVVSAGAKRPKTMLSMAATEKSSFTPCRNRYRLFMPAEKVMESTEVMPADCLVPSLLWMKTVFCACSRATPDIMLMIKTILFIAW